MTREELAAEALASWTIRTLRKGVQAIGRQELPSMNVTTFLRAFKDSDGIPTGISLALVGFEKTETQLQQISRKEAPDHFGSVATDLHKAASWRNRRKKHRVVIAYARGRVTGVNTLKHFEQASSNELAVTLLEWAKGRAEFTSTPAHVRLLEALKSSLESEATFSFEQVRSFLESWSKQGGTDGPRRALPCLLLFPDPNLFSDASQVHQRLADNVQAVSQLRDRTPAQMDSIRKRLVKHKLAKAVKIFEKLQLIRKNPAEAALSAVTLDDALEVLRPKIDKTAPMKARPTTATRATSRLGY